MRPAAHILIVEDEGLVAEEIALRIEQMGHVVSGVVDNAGDAFEHARTIRPDMALLDINIKGAHSGLEIARRFRDEFHVPVVFLTAHADPATLLQATDAEPFGYVVKPFDERTLAATVETALRRYRAEEKLSKMEHWLAATMTSIGDGVIATDRDFHVSFINPVAEQLCGIPPGSALGRPVAEVFRIGCAGGRSVMDVIAEATSESLVVGLDECQLYAADGATVPIDDTVAPIRDESGNVGGVVIVFRDARQRQHYEQELLRLNAELEDTVRRRTAQLQAVNQELASFSYSIAHDLRAPLRAINGFASLVVQQHGTTLDDEGRRLLEVVVSRAGQMGRMIDDYLKLSGLSRVALNRRPLNMTALAREAWTLAADGVMPLPELQLGDLPAIEGDQDLVRQVWVNLLSNAIKFARGVAKPLVRVSSAIEAGTVCYCIEDNGIGFDPSQASKLFRVFERLHTQQEVEGNGVGLCIVQRIVHRHEGDITISGKPGQGACVKFWLPRTVAARTVSST
jgi:PAS domain S-box-containing protein